MPLQINTLPFWLGILDQVGEMPVRTSFHRNIDMSETEVARIILWDSVKPCLASGYKVNVSPLKLLESIVKNYRAWHFIFHPVISALPLLTARTTKPKCFYTIAARQWWTNLHAFYLKKKTPWLFGCGGDYIHQSIWLPSWNSAGWAKPEVWRSGTEVRKQFNDKIQLHIWLGLGQEDSSKSH